MTTHDSLHTPRPEFRAALERDVVRALRDETRVTPLRRLMRFRTPMTLAAGLVIGMSTQLALGQVQKGRERSELEVAIDLKRAIAASKLELAQANYTRAKLSSEVGATSNAALLAAEAELYAQQAAAYRLQVDLDEVRQTANAPRDELWAPLVGGRDFVKDRLNADASAAQRKQAAAEAAFAEIERRYRAGAATKGALDEAQAALEDAKSDFESIAYKLTLRRQALQEHITPQVVSQRLDRFDLVRQMQHLDRLARSLQQNYDLSRQKLDAGAIDSLELLRLRVRLLETTSELKALRDRFSRLPKE